MTQPLLTLFEEIETLVKSLQEENQQLKRQLADSAQAKQQEMLARTATLQQTVEALEEKEKSYEARLLQLRNQLGSPPLEPPDLSKPADALIEKTPPPTKKPHATLSAKTEAPSVSAAASSHKSVHTAFTSGAATPSSAKQAAEDFFSSPNSKETTEHSPLKQEKPETEKPSHSSTAVPWENFVEEEDPFAEAASKAGEGLSDEEFSTRPFSN